MDIKKTVHISLLSALSVILVYFIHFPLIPGAPFLEYDPADIVIIITGLMYGIPGGVLATAIVSVIQGITVSAASGWIGIVMHFLSTSVFVITISLVYKKTAKMLVAMLFGVVLTVLVMIPLNLIFTGIFLGAGVFEVAKLLVPAIIPFNLLKASINAIVASVIYKRIKKII